MFAHSCSFCGLIRRGVGPLRVSVLRVTDPPVMASGLHAPASLGGCPFSCLLATTVGCCGSESTLTAVAAGPHGRLQGLLIFPNWNSGPRNTNSHFAAPSRGTAPTSHLYEFGSSRPSYQWKHPVLVPLGLAHVAGHRDLEVGLLCEVSERRSFLRLTRSVVRTRRVFCVRSPLTGT